MKPEFIEDFNSPACDPVDGQGHYDFPYNDVAQLLGEVEQETEGDYPAMTLALRKLFQWVVQGNFQVGDKLERHIGKKLIALAWVLDPGLFRGTPSLRGLAQRLKHDSAMVMSHLTADAARKFGVQNRAQTTFGNEHVKSYRAGKAVGDGQHKTTEQA